MTDQTHWRLALMFDAKRGDIVDLEIGLAKAALAIRAAAGGYPVRIGVAEQLPEPAEDAESAHETGAWRSVDGAIEITLANGAQGQVAEICRALRPILEELADIGSVEIMTGPMFHMVPVRKGATFLSLAFRRFSGKTPAQFSIWWYSCHSQMAIPVMGPGMLAYDQVHVEPSLSTAAAKAFGVRAADYDAYDNLTWANPEGFFTSCSDMDGMMRLAADERDNIDNDSRRHSLMREIG